MKLINNKYLRRAARAVIIKEGKILLISTSRGDYKFPGGALEADEIAKEALAREVKEESGYKDCSILEYLGSVTERRQDKYDSEKFFEMVSEYYLATVGEKGNLELSENEKKYNFKPEWIELKVALERNLKFLNKGISKSDWAHRETKVLSILAKQGSSTNNQPFEILMTK